MRFLRTPITYTSAPHVRLPRGIKVLALTGTERQRSPALSASARSVGWSGLLGASFGVIVIYLHERLGALVPLEIGAVEQAWVVDGQCPAIIVFNVFRWTLNNHSAIHPVRNAKSCREIRWIDLSGVDIYQGNRDTWSTAALRDEDIVACEVRLFADGLLRTSFEKTGLRINA